MVCSRLILAYISELLCLWLKACSPAVEWGPPGTALGHTEDLHKGVDKEGASGAPRAQAGHLGAR